MTKISLKPRPLTSHDSLHSPAVLLPHLGPTHFRLDQTGSDCTLVRLAQDIFQSYDSGIFKTCVDWLSYLQNRCKFSVEIGNDTF
jgi:hypothetical protein